jgi:citrate synthase
LAAGVLRAEEQWYLISEAELRSIEQYKETSEREKRSWLLQAQGLKQDSASLNAQLAEAREQNRKSEQLFNEYEKDQLEKISLKNGEIADLKAEAATEKQKRTKAEGTAALRLAIIIALVAVIVLYIAFKICRFFRLIP